MFYRQWPALVDEGVGAVVLMHRGHEHGGRMAHLVDELDLPDHAFYAWDARGHGESPGPRGDAPSFAALVRDLDRFVAHIAEQDGFDASQLVIVAQSVGAVVATAWVHDYAPALRALVVASPAFAVRLYVPFARRGLTLLRSVFGPFSIKSYVKSTMLTHDEDRAESYDTDPLVTKPISVDLLLALADAGDRIVADAEAITTPTLLLISGSDAVVEHAPQHEFFVRLGSATKERHVLDGFFHDTLGERDRAPVIGQIRQFVLDRFAEPLETHNWLNAHRQSYTRKEAEALATPLSPYSLSGLRWSLTRAILRVGAWFSEGLAVGHAAGFDSGESLDYVYQNQARGLGPIGRIVDRIYLDQTGWRGIRARKELVEELILTALQRLEDQHLPRVILDIAAGHGRYVLDAMSRSTVSIDDVVMRDAALENIRAGRNAIEQRGRGSTVSFRVADAFDADSIAASTPPPTLAIVSGLYELYADNQKVRQSLAGLTRALPAGGFLVYTNQPWHPQLELIARALTSHLDGDAWVMRRRTQAEMDQLVTAAGFTKIEQRIEVDGLFTVSLARRNE